MLLVEEEDVLGDGSFRLKFPQGPVDTGEYVNISYVDFWEEANEELFPGLRKDWWIIAILVSVLALIMVIGLLANFSIIFIILKNKMFLLQPANLLLLNMCISDFINLLINPWLFIFKSGNQPVIFRFYYLGDFLCRVTPFMIVSIMLTSVLSLTAISVNRYYIINHMKNENMNALDKRRRAIRAMVVLIWLFSFLASSPTLFMSRYWTRQWSDLLEIVCDEAPNAEWTALYWDVTIVFLVWIPTLIMAACYGFIFKKIRRSARKSPYLSESSRTARSTGQVVKMLSILLLVQFISWFPWQFFTIFNETAAVESDLDSNYVEVVSPIMFYIKYYFVFTGSTLNPILYGFNNVTMRRAFRLTFPFLFKEKANYVMKRKADGTTTIRVLMDNKASKNSAIHKAIIETGLTGVIPVSSCWERDHDTLQKRLVKIIHKITRSPMKAPSAKFGLKKSNSTGQLLNLRLVVNASTPIPHSRNASRRKRKTSSFLGIPEMLVRKFSSGSMDRTSTVTNFVHSSTTLGGTVAETVVECSTSSCSVANIIETKTTAAVLGGESAANNNITINSCASTDKANIAVDIKIKVTAPLANDMEEEQRQMPPANMPTLRKTGVGPMMRPLEAVVERQQSEMATHVSIFTSKFRKRSNTR